MTNYEIYVEQIAFMSERLGFPLVPMTSAEFDQAEAALHQKLPHTHTSVIDMDAFEAAFSG